MKKKLIIIGIVLIVITLAGVGIFLGTAKESQPISTDNIHTYYDVNVEIKNYIRGQKKAEILGLFASYEPSTAKFHITVTPKDDISCDSTQLIFSINEKFWELSDGKDEITVTLNSEGTTELTVDIMSDLKISALDEPSSENIDLTSASGTVTYKKFFNSFNK